MKVLIWALTFIIGACVNTLIGYATGIRVGSMLLFLAEWYIAKKLCEKWDVHKKKKEERKKAAQSESTSAIKASEPVPEFQPPVAENTVSTQTNESVQFCHKCGAKLVNGAKYCQKCGTEALVITDSD